MSKRNPIECTTVNPAYEEGSKMWKAVGVLAGLAFAAWLLF